jgi:hypothetical protein
MRNVWLVSLFAAAMAAGCGGNSASLTTPSAATPSGANVTGGTAVNDARGDGSEVQGRIQALPPATAPLTFTVNGETVKTDESTQFVSAGGAVTFVDLKIGMETHVKGTLSGSILTAGVVEIDQDQNEPEPEPGDPAPAPQPNEVELSGTVSSVSGTSASFQFMVNGSLVKGDGTTTFTRDGNVTPSFSMLANGEAVEVTGTQQTGFVQAARIQIENEPGQNEPGNDDNEGAEVEVRGTLGAVSGTCPAITSTVAGTGFTTSASTRFDDASCASLKSGDIVEVKGTKRSAGTIAATRVKRDDN